MAEPKDMRPVAVVEDQEFTHLMNTLEPGYVVPSKKKHDSPSV